MEFELVSFEGRMLTVEEIEFLKCLREKRAEQQMQRERKAQQQTQMELNAVLTRVIEIKVKPEPKAVPPPVPPVPSKREAIESAEEPESKRFVPSIEIPVPVSVHSAAGPDMTLHPEAQEVSITKKAVSGPVDAAAPAAERPVEKGNVQKYVQRQRKVVTVDELDDRVFPAEGLLQINNWNPSANKLEMRGREFPLRGFSMGDNQTIALKVTVSSASTRWAINICPADHQGFNEILFHINPRRFKKEELLMNARKEGTWLKHESLPLDTLPPLFGSSARDCTFELIIQFRDIGVCTFLNRNFLSYFAHRRAITGLTQLALQLPSTDDNGNFNDALFHKVWWGHLDNSFLRLPSDLEVKTDTLEESISSVFIKGLPRQDTEDVANLLWALFEEFSPVAVNVISVKGVAYVRLASPEFVHKAIERLHGESISAGGEGADTFTLSLSRSS